jgi:hypothetical protein
MGLFFYAVFLKLQLAVRRFFEARLQEIALKPYQNDVVNGSMTAAQVAVTLRRWIDRNLDPATEFMYLTACSSVAAMITRRAYASWMPKLRKIELQPRHIHDVESYRALRWLTEFQTHYEHEFDNDFLDALSHARSRLALSAGVCLNCFKPIPQDHYVCDACERIEIAFVAAKFNIDLADE